MTEEVVNILFNLFRGKTMDALFYQISAVTAEEAADTCFYLFDVRIMTPTWQKKKKKTPTPSFIWLAPVLRLQSLDIFYLISARTMLSIRQ